MRIAVVEDEHKIAETLKEGLETEGYDIDLFPDGAKAEAKIVADAAVYGLILLDLMLPDKDGLEVCRALRNAGVGVPIIVLTARDTVEDKVRALDNGADDFLTKPFSFQELTARIRAVARRAWVPVTGSTLGRNGLEVNLRTQEVKRDGKPLQLTPTEFGLVVLLLESAEPVSREAISMHLWDAKDASLTNIVDVHISNLRKKIEHGDTKKIIRTVRGLGYQI